MPSLSVANHSESTGTVPVERDRCLESSVACHLPLAPEGGRLVDYQAVLISHRRLLHICTKYRKRART